MRLPFWGKPKGVCLEVVEEGAGNKSEGQIRIKLTETVGAYRKGEVLTLSAFQAVPVKQERPLVRGEYFRRVRTDYKWVKS